MRSSIFPLNPNAIDRQRIFRSTNCDIDANANATISHTHSDNVHGKSSDIIGDTTFGSSDRRQRDDQFTIDVIDSSRLSNSFPNYQWAISTLDQVLQVLNENSDQHDVNKEEESSHGDSSGNDDDQDDIDDDDFVPTTIHFRSSNSISSLEQRVILSRRVSSADRQRSNYPKHGERSKRTTSQVLGFDATDEGHWNSFQSFDWTEERLFCLDEETMPIDPSPTPAQRTIEAINNTLRSVLGTAGQQPSTQLTSRTVLKRTIGQIMTEKDVIEHIEEKQNKNKKLNLLQANRRSDSARRKTARKGILTICIQKFKC
jgi:hypothetical protein